MVNVLARIAQHNARGGHDSQSRARVEQYLHEGATLRENLLAVIKHEQLPSRLQGSDDQLAQRALRLPCYFQGVHDALLYGERVRRKPHEPHRIEFCADAARHFRGKLGFAGPWRAHNCYQAVLDDQVAQFLELALPSNERPLRSGDAVAGGNVPRRARPEALGNLFREVPEQALDFFMLPMRIPDRADVPK